MCRLGDNGNREGDGRGRAFSGGRACFFLAYIIFAVVIFIIHSSLTTRDHLGHLRIEEINHRSDTLL